MKNNANINSRLIDLLEVLDARATVTIFIEKEDGKNIKESTRKVYEFLSDNDFRTVYRKYEVIGLYCGLVTDILIKEEA